MARIKGGMNAKKKHNRILKLAKGYFGRKSTVFKTATQAVIKSAMYAYRDRRNNKRNDRRNDRRNNSRGNDRGNNRGNKPQGQRPQRPQRTENKEN